VLGADADPSRLTQAAPAAAVQTNLRSRATV
jgi:hypothetical protein